jgi:glycosyltransferase involved in cell wall biosynthesis
MKIAYFSPMPPAKSGIATYSKHLVPALSEHAQVTVFSPGECNWYLEDCEVIDFTRFPWELKTLPRFDNVIYHLGNNPHFHLDIYRTFCEFPGVVVLHDLVLYYLVAGLGIGGVIKEYCRTHGCGKLDRLWPQIDVCPDGDLLRYGSPEKLPFLERTLEKAASTIVHSQSSSEWIREISGARVDVVPLPYYPADVQQAATVDTVETRRALGLQEQDFVVGLFGFIGPTKRLPKVLDAVNRLRKESPETAWKVLIVGEGDSLREEIEARHLGDSVVETGYVNDAQFTACLAVVDALVNLRFPSMGESSATLIRAMALGKVAIVTDHASFAEFPIEATLKVSYGESEVDEIVSVLRRLVNDEGHRHSIEWAARHYIFENCSIKAIAAAYLRVLERTKRTGTGEIKVSQADSSKLWAKTYLKWRIEDLVPD